VYSSTSDSTVLLGPERYNSGAMALSSFAKKLFRTAARVIPQCGMVSPAVAFTMFLAFFRILNNSIENGGNREEEGQCQQ
jgi:hypothetical protein